MEGRNEKERKEGEVKAEWRKEKKGDRRKEEVGAKEGRERVKRMSIKFKGSGRFGCK